MSSTVRKLDGFTLIESIVAIAIFVTITAGVFGLFSILAKAVKVAREQTVLSALAASRLEIMRNLPYSEVGTLSGNPNGSLPDFVSPNSLTYEGIVYEVYYEVIYVDDTADGTILAGTDSAPNDYKQVKMYIKNTGTGKTTSFVTNASPKGLEGLNNAGALVIKAFDANGQPVSNASISIDTVNAGTPISLNRQTDGQGNWTEVGLPAGVNDYRISVTKAGYSTDTTYPISAGNPNPIKTDATVANGTVTQVTFAIDLLANLQIKTLNTSCSPISGVAVNVSGSKLIGTSPNIYKYNQNLTSGGAGINLNNIEWDVYNPVLLTGQGNMIYGTSPIQQVNVLPGASQIATLILGPTSTNSLLVIVKDLASGAALENAHVTLSRAAPSYSDDKFTGGSVWIQNDWTGGSGQIDFVSANMYFDDDGNIDDSFNPVLLRLSGVNYVPAGQLTSSTFDTGGTSNYTTLEWEPTSQNPSTTLRFQIASNNDNATWDFTGPDGTDQTFYAVPGTSLHASHNGDRYVRYKAYLATSDNSFSPQLSNFRLNYVSGCNTPGQVIFPSLAAGNNYALNVVMPGFIDYNANNLNINGNQTLEVLMTP